MGTSQASPAQHSRTRFCSASWPGKVSSITTILERRALRAHGDSADLVVELASVGLQALAESLDCLERLVPGAAAGMRAQLDLPGSEALRGLSSRRYLHGLVIAALAGTAGSKAIAVHRELLVSVPYARPRAAARPAAAASPSLRSTSGASTEPRRRSCSDDDDVTDHLDQVEIVAPDRTSEEVPGRNT